MDSIIEHIEYIYPRQPCNKEDYFRPDLYVWIAYINNILFCGTNGDYVFTSQKAAMNSIRYYFKPRGNRAMTQQMSNQFKQLQKQGIIVYKKIKISGFNK